MIAHMETQATERLLNIPKAMSLNEVQDKLFKRASLEKYVSRREDRIENKDTESWRSISSVFLGLPLASSMVFQLQRNLLHDDFVSRGPSLFL